jgi:SAM-dependent methyltransferase
MADAYAADVEDGPYNAHYERPNTIALLGDVAGRHVLELGCGSGPLTAWLVDHGATVSALDVSPEMLRLAADRVGRAASLRVADAAHPLPFLANSFDLVVGSLVLHYIEAWEPVLREVRRVLRPSGTAVFSTHHPTMDWLAPPPEDDFPTTSVTEVWEKGTGEFEVTFWRRPLTAMTDAIATAGFVVERLVEPEPAPDLAESHPGAYATLRASPRFLFFRLEPR